MSLPSRPATFWSPASAAREVEQVQGDRREDHPAPAHPGTGHHLALRLCVYLAVFSCSASGVVDWGLAASKADFFDDYCSVEDGVSAGGAHVLCAPFLPGDQ